MKKVSLERKAFLLALISLDGVGSQTVFKILKFCQKRQITIAEFWGNKYNAWQEIHLKEKTVESIKKFKKEHNLLDNLLSLESSGIQVITFEELSYPSLLSTTEDLPAVLFVKSRIKAGSQDWRNALDNTISVVGTRRITSYGQGHSFWFYVWS